MAEGFLVTECREQPLPAESAGTGRVGRYRLLHGDTVLDPLTPPLTQDERSFLRMTEISKMKGQGLVCARNAKLIAVNLRYIAYAMKEGCVRVINQNGKDLFKLHNSTKAVITDMAVNGTGVEQGTTFMCVDEAAHVSVFLLEARATGLSSEERAKRVELVFPSSMEPPQRVLSHPTDNRTFVTLHASHLGVWSLTRLEQEDPREATTDSGFITHSVDERLMASASQHFALPDASSRPCLRDAAVSVDGRCLIALAEDALFVWRLNANWTGEAEAPELLQKLSLAAGAASGAGLHSIRILGTTHADGCSQATDNTGAEVMILGSGTGCELFAYQLMPAASLPVGALLQSIRVVPSNADNLIGCIGANSITHDRLGLAFRNEPLVLVFPLAIGGSPGCPHLPLPFAQRFVTDGPAHQLSIMTGTSYQTAGHTLFMYRAHNFTREKDSLLGCTIVVHEVDDPSLVAREEPPEGGAAASPQLAGADIDPPPAALVAPTPPQAPRAAAASAADAEVPASPAAAATRATTPSVAAPAVQQHAPDLLPMANGGQESCPLPMEPTGGDPAPLDVAEDDPASEPPGRDPSPPPGLRSPDAPMNSSGEEALPAAASTTDAGGAEPAVACGADSAGDDEGYAGGSMVGDTGAAGSSSAGAGGAQDLAPSSSKRHHRQPPEAQPDRPDLDWGFVKQIAASFVRGLEKKRGEIAERILSEVSEVVRSTAAGAGAGDGDRAALEQALTRVREAREAQATYERNFQAAALKATDSWAEASATAVAGLLQKELGKISDGVAATLAQQLSQSKKFCEALARGVQKSGGVATKQALEALRLPKHLQETVGSALTEALHESLAPVFRAELRTHFEQELAPLIGQRVGQMMTCFQDRMGQCLDKIAEEHELAGQRLGRSVAHVVAEELRQVERVTAQLRHSGSPAAGAALSEAQLDELARTVQAEVVQPLHARIKELTTQVQTLREEARRLERRWSACRASTSSAAWPLSAGASLMGPSFGVRAPPALSAAEREEAQARDLEHMFREGKVGDAFIHAMSLQDQALHCDYLERLCALVPDGGLEEWLAGNSGASPGGGSSSSSSPLKMQIKMYLMVSLAKQLEGGVDVSEPVRARKIEWISELWFAFDPAEQSVADKSAMLCTQLTEALERIQAGGCGSGAADQLRRLRKAVQQLAKILKDK